MSTSTVSEREKCSMNDENDEREQTPAGVGAVLVDAAPEPETLQCPRCGDRHIRQRGPIVSVCISLVSCALTMLVALAIFLLVTYVVMQLHWRRGLRFFSIAFMLPGCVILAVVWLKLLANCRCRVCGWRFRGVRFLDRPQAQWPFPLRHCILNGIVLLACFAAYQGMPTVMARGSAVGLLMFSPMASISAVFLAGVSIAGHGLLYVLLCRKLKNDLLWAIVFVLPAVFFGHSLLRGSFPVVTAGILLSNGQLAELPESARDVQVYHWSSLFAGQEYLRFSAEPNDIRAFLRQSPILKDKTSRRYKIEPMYRSVPGDPETAGRQGEAKWKMYPLHSNGPTWYRPGIDNPARRYEIQPKDYQLPGEVIVDDEQNVIYVYLCFS
jgi:hypothetical protein